MSTSNKPEPENLTNPNVETSSKDLREKVLRGGQANTWQPFSFNLPAGNYVERPYSVDFNSNPGKTNFSLQTSTSGRISGTYRPEVNLSDYGPGNVGTMKGILYIDGKKEDPEKGPVGINQPTGSGGM